MKNNKGVTLTSLIIYVIGMVIVVASISTLTTFFYKNIDTSAINDNTTTQYTKFLSYFTEEINNSNNKVVECKNNYIIFSSGNQYTYIEENKSKSSCEATAFLFYLREATSQSLCLHKTLATAAIT